MSDTVIKVENLSKRYRLGLKESRKDTLFAQLGHTLTAPVRNFKRLRSMTKFDGEDDSIFWALRDINFEVKQGEVLGIIGHNGAGKSTLLKLLSRITEPTTGSITLKGRVAALLEVGTGFHQDLTGRENIYMNGTILGMTKKEIDRKLDEIIAFSGVEKHLDTPVKFYSSGMKVRLGFSVAAHLDPEILIIDEVLAVGDAQFQKKCLGKMESVAGEGRTVLFVSHTMPMINRLCDRAILLKKGHLIMNGRTIDVSNKYLSAGRDSPAEVSFSDIETAPGDNVAKIKAVRVINSKGNLSEEISIDEPFYLEMEYFNLSTKHKATAVFHLISDQGILILGTNDFVNRVWYETRRKEGIVKARCEIPANFMTEGKFYISAAITSYNPNSTHIFQKEIISFIITDNTQGEGARGPYIGSYWPGVVRPLLKWEVEQLNP